MAKPNETDRWAAVSELELKQFWMIAAGAEVRKFYNGGAEAGAQLKFEFLLYSPNVGQAR